MAYVLYYENVGQIIFEFIKYTILMGIFRIPTLFEKKLNFITEVKNDEISPRGSNAI